MLAPSLLLLLAVIPQDEGHMFVYNVFPFPLPKYLYWAFVGLLFRDSAPKVIRYYWDMVSSSWDDVGHI